MDILTYYDDWKDSWTDASGGNGGSFFMDQISQHNINNVTYDFMLVIVPTRPEIQNSNGVKNYKRNQFQTIIYVGRNKQQKEDRDKVVVWKALQDKLDSALTHLLAKSNYIATTGNRVYDYIDEEFGGNSLLEVRLELTIETSNC